MSYAGLIIGHINERRNELRRLFGASGRTTARDGSDQWNARETLLHLIGATVDVAPAVRRALTEDAPRIASEQAGGEYLPRPGADSVEELFAALLAQLAEITTAVQDLDDDALRRPITIVGNRDGDLGVPLGLWIRNAVGEHFELHVTQLRQALS